MEYIKDIGTRQKEYEIQPVIDLSLPVVARVDGMSFSKFTKNLSKPHDIELGAAMMETALHLLVKFQPTLVYTQSDEISLMWVSTDLWGGNVNKIVSDLAVETSLCFNKKFKNLHIKEAKFDARVWNVPDIHELANYVFWRELDAVRNSTSMLAQCYFSQDALQGKSYLEVRELLSDIDVYWHSYPDHFRRGAYFKKQSASYVFDALNGNLPSKHNAWRQAELVVTRPEYRRLEVPPLVETTHQERLELLFNYVDRTIEST